MGVIRDTADKLWRGELTTRQQHPFTATGELEEVAPNIVFCRWLANFTLCATGEGLVMIDTGGYANQEQTFALVRGYSAARVHTAIYTHGHLDHAGGLVPFIAEAGRNRVARPRVVGHRAIADHFDRYKRSGGYNHAADRLQYGIEAPWPADLVYPDTYFDHQLNVVAGNERFQCHHAWGETEDHCWVYIPNGKVLCTGDFFTWGVPSAGNPLRAARHALKWAEALRAMAKTGAEVMLPGHGSPIFGGLKIRQALGDTAEYLQQLYDQTLAMMNAGAPLDEILGQVKPSEELAQKPYLQPVFDEPQFVLRNIWRTNGGWYDGAPAHLLPASSAEQAREIAELAGGVEKLVQRARARMDEGGLALACHLIDWAAQAAPEDGTVHELRAAIYGARAAQASSTLSYEIFLRAATDSAARAGIAPPEHRRQF